MIKRVALTLLVPISLVLAYFALYINSGACELTRWTTLILSNMTALYFGIIMTTGAAGGLIASRQKTKKRKIVVNASTLAIVLLLINTVGRFMPFLGYTG